MFMFNLNCIKIYKCKYFQNLYKHVCIYLLIKYKKYYIFIIIYIIKIYTYIFIILCVSPGHGFES